MLTQSTPIASSSTAGEWAACNLYYPRTRRLSLPPQVYGGAHEGTKVHELRRGCHEELAHNKQHPASDCSRQQTKQTVKGRQDMTKKVEAHQTEEGYQADHGTNCQSLRQVKHMTTIILAGRSDDANSVCTWVYSPTRYTKWITGQLVGDRC